jgi:hypothetical protein
MGYCVSWAAPANRSLSNIAMNNAIQTKGHAMKKVYIGIDTHKDSNTVALAFAGNEAPELYGKASADLRVFEATLRRIMPKRSADNFRRK